MNRTLPSSVLRAITDLNRAGFEAYVVGGCVRDTLMGKSPYDWDITTSALPDETLAVFSAYRTIHTGLQHGTVTVVIDELPLEITTYRIDGTYSDGRHPDSVAFTPSLTEDLRRRDFTINAMAYHPDLGLVDPFGGRKDLEHSVIRCVGDPMQRFTEDALRILRGLRFASALGFAIENATADAIHRLAPTLHAVSVERITSECKRLLCGNYATEILENFADVFAVFMPETANKISGVRLSDLPSVLRVRLAALFQAADMSGEQAADILRRLRLDTQTITDVNSLLTPLSKSVYTEDAYILRLLNRLGPELVWDYFALHNMDVATIQRTKALLDGDACYKVSMLAIDGQDLMRFGMPSGPKIGQTLNRLLESVMDGVCDNTKSSLLDYLKEQKEPVP